MKQSWTVSGTYANWTMTVDISPTGDRGDFAVPDWPGEKLGPVVGHFFEAVNFYEVSRDAQEVYGLG
ncbi:hypothetical protein [Amycolatopsis sp. H20-H5]|uniref:hypothetical protein n=1 Tax=Amycolatopsis sp. H20-H5 TaxID=3046309 RepID=UPI002DBF0521|nr:hypothetical protein [Amycolatopsis sp. H20-H5]MEC3979457.1 hypothetical protein [Amycolatopsis sp. H20-H5]